jgi:replication factor C small subunit
MENYAQTTRFILSANYSSKIIDPIQSRCAVFRFRPLPEVDVLKIITSIAKDQNLKIDEAAKLALYGVSEGDCRKTENILQSCAAITDHITEDSIYSLASVAKPKEIFDVLNLALKNEFLKSRDKLLDVMLNYGLSGIDVIKQIQKEVYNLTLDGRQRLALVAACGETEFRLSEGSDEYVQLEAFLAQVALAGQK